MKSYGIETHKMAAVVLFKDLHSKKLDVYDILASFVKDIILEKRLTRFSPEDINSTLQQEYGFDSVPMQIVRNSIKRIKMVKREGTDYVVDNLLASKEKSHLGKDFDSEVDKNQKIIDLLYEFIEERRNVLLCESEKQKIASSFCGFLFDSAMESEYVVEIAAFVMQLSNEDYKQQIDEITEGVYQYAALTYSEDISKIDSLKNELTIFLDTDILLSLGGYHGEVYKKSVEEMLNLLFEINTITKKRYIVIRYMKYVWQEVSDVFNSAIFYVNGQNYYNREAAENIATGCSSEEDVLAKKANLLAVLKSKGIIEYDITNRYEEPLIKYNIEGDETLASLISDGISKNDIEKAAKRVSDINRLRTAFKCHSFEDSKYLWVTDNGKVQMVSNHFSKNFGTYNFAMSPGKLTSILWLKMNKGLAKKPLPESLSVITRSRVILSSCTSTKMREEMDKLNKQIDSGEMVKEALYEMLAEFKNYAKHPEDITNESVEINLNYLETEMKAYGEELSLYKNKAEREKNEKDKVLSSFKEYTELISQKEKLEKELQEKEDRFNKSKECQKQYEKSFKNSSRIVRIVCAVLGLALLFFIPFLVLKNVEIEWIADREWVVSLAVDGLGIILCWLIGKNIKVDLLPDLIIHKVENKLKTKYGINSDSNVNEQDCEMLRKQIDCIESQIKNMSLQFEGEDVITTE